MNPDVNINNNEVEDLQEKLLEVTMELEKTRDRLQEKEAYISSVLNGFPWLMWLKDRESRFVAVNDACASACGRNSSEDVKGKTDLDIWPRNLAEQYRQDDQKVMDRQANYNVEELISESGCEKWFETYKSPVFDSRGGVTGTTGFARDITERKDAERALNESEKRLKLVLEGSNDGFWDWDIRTGHIDVSPRWAAILELELDEIDLNVSFWESRIHPDDRAFVFSALDEHLNGKTAFYETEHRLLSNSNQWKWILDRGKVVEWDSEGKPLRMAGTHTDITARRMALEDLKYRDRLLEGVARAMNCLLTSSNFVYSLHMALTILGEAAQVSRVYIFDYSLEPGYDEPTLTQRYEWVNQGITPQIDNPELQHIPFRSTFPRWYDLLTEGEAVKGLAKDIPHFEQPFLLAQDIISLLVIPILIQGQFRGFVGFDDCQKEREWAEVEISILHAAAGAIGNAIERQRREEVLRETSSAAQAANVAKSQFLASMSHEIRTPMNAIIGMTSLLLDTSLNEVQSDYAGTIRTSGEALLTLINDILDFSKIESGHMDLECQPFNVLDCVEE